jgi:hypothetical protein
MPYPYHTEPAHNEGPLGNVSGNIATQTGEAALITMEGRQALDVSDTIYVLKETQNPFTRFLTSQGKNFDGNSVQGIGLLTRQVTGPKFDCMTDAAPGRIAKVSGTYAASGPVTITVNGAGTTPAKVFTVGDILRNARTGEQFTVATIPSASTFTVAAARRAFGSTPAAAGADGDVLEIIGNSSEEGAVARNANRTELTDEYNYCQIFRESVMVTGTYKATKLMVGVTDLERQRRQKAIKAVKDIEMTFLFGERVKTTGTVQGHTERRTGGVKEHIEGSGAPVHDQGNNPMTSPDFNAALAEQFVVGSTKKLMVGGSRINVALTEIARNQLQTTNDMTTYGMSIAAWKTPMGYELRLASHPEFNQLTGRDGYSFVLDVFEPDHSSYRYAHFREPKLIPEIQAVSADAYAEEILCEVGLDRCLPEQNGIIKNVA